MIICSCNVIRDCDIRAAAGRGCRDGESAYRSMGCGFVCGGCRELADDIVDEARRQPAADDRCAA
ncbi:(2Fe-2S)-binding protein [Sphingomonas sp.]|uniref:(2Fe-2S)-binding protein n=1 Tax=Sphingomonas sp. TaxID=28214 RepID=UPI00286C3CBE|nr:(2Fe-2S)-binding protein [Sphingomonas sp.]